MSNLKHAQREALALAIESKVHHLDLATLVRLAAELKVPVPSGIKAARGNVRQFAPRPSDTTTSALAGDGIGPAIAVSEGNQILDAITDDNEASDWADSELVGAGELVKRLDISRGTLDNWRKANKIIAFRKGLRNFVYPLRQFERLKPIEGLDVVAGFFPTPEESWEWLVGPNAMTDGKAPIELLRKRDVARVVGAAEGALDYA